MTSTAPHPVWSSDVVPQRPHGVGSGAPAHLPPNWFAAVMGTGIVGIAAVTSPVHVDGQRAVGVVMWLLAATLLAVLATATLRQFRRWPELARSHVADPVTVHFYGAVPMAVLTVGTSTLLAGRDVIGSRAALAVDAAFWTAGTVGGLATTIAVPLVVRARGGYRAGAAFGGWLMPVVPPMVSAAGGALLAPHVPAGPPRTVLLIACYLLFAVSAVASAVVVPAVVRRLWAEGPGPARLVPTLWIVLGPLGQSITAVALLGRVAPSPLAAIGYAYGLVVWFVAMAWLAVVLAVTVRTARAGLPFALTWWSFTFPVGTCVTGTGALAAHSGSAVFTVVSGVLLAGLAAAWLVVAARTWHGAVGRRYLLAAPSAG